MIMMINNNNHFQNRPMLMEFGEVFKATKHQERDKHDSITTDGTRGLLLKHEYSKDN